MDEKRIYWAFKVSTCGNQLRRDHVRGLTLEEVHDAARFPYGVQEDHAGRFTWSHALDPDFMGRR